jgi:hypothetical protein
MVADYEEWVKATFDMIDDTDRSNGWASSMRDTLTTHKGLCLTSLARMRMGLEELKDERVFEAFCFMNHAMALQRVHKIAADAKIAKGLYVEPVLESIPKGDRPVWRPFQMGFILRCLEGIVDPKCEDRSVLDLLWVPTGGGKTEAYLGLSAFTLAYRRLSNGTEEHFKYAGVSIIMRYTLRLLTIQQFQRAASLFCAMEYLRSKNLSKWGRESFRVGLYIGRDTTPNLIGPSTGDSADKTADYALDGLRRGKDRPEKHNPFQLVHCPWCGEELTAASYDIDTEGKHLITKCPREGCEFHRLEIPVLTVDEDIYRHLPSLLISTVDKFAQVPFNPEIGSLFGLVRSYCPTHGFMVDEGHTSVHHSANQRVERIPNGLRPPDLVIQDELHLINGPLGSMVGLYESSFIAMCKRRGTIGPKYIASTATIRKAEDQVRELYDLEVQSFPSPGTSFSDSFFVKEYMDDDESKVYIGLHPSAIGQKTVMIRTMACILNELANIKTEGRIPLKDWDDYWTLVSYYDSIRALGSAVTTISDDVQNIVSKSGRTLRTQELTSRVDSKGLTDILTLMSVSGDSPSSYDILTCSNMFSVGVDVTRLGLMIMNNQPKTASEYIQATGRVGRSKSGLVIVIYNWNRPRDQSHFERFYDFHNRIQAHVEAMTVTPFSKGARERALHAQYVAILRNMGEHTLSKQMDAKYYSATVRAKYRWIEDLLIERARSRHSSLAKVVKSELDRFTDEWIDAAVSYELRYRPGYNRNGGEDTLMITNYGEMNNNNGPAIFTPNSMRNVEEEVQLFKVRMG